MVYTLFRNTSLLFAACFVLFLLCGFQQNIASADTSSDSGCKAVFDASDKSTTTPHHLYDTSPGLTANESIAVDGFYYVLIKGKWKKSPLTVKAQLEQGQENRKNAKSYSCTYVRDEPVDGEPAAVYSTHAVMDEDLKSDCQVWISKSRGLILRQEEDVDTGEKTHHSIRYDYNNVHAPGL